MPLLSDYHSRILKIDPVKRQTLISFLSIVILTGVGFLSTMYFAHVLGPAVLGGYFLFVTYFGIFNLIGDGGFGSAAVKRISEGEQQNAYFTAFFCIRLVLLVLSIALLLMIRPYLVDFEASGFFWWLVAALVAGLFFSVSMFGIYGRGKVGVKEIGNLLNNVLKFVIQVFLVYLGYMSAGLAGGFIAGMIGGFLLNMRYFDLQLAMFDAGHVKSLMNFSFWIFLASSGSLIFSYTDTIFIGYFLSNSDVGIYRVAFQFTTAATFVTLALQRVLYPKISYLGKQHQLEVISGLLSRAFSYSLILAVPVAVGGWILGSQLLYYLYGASFAKGSTAFSILLAVQIVNVFMYLVTMSLSALDHPRQSFYATGAAVIINILLNVFLIPVYGIDGAAMATLATILVNTVIAVHYLSDYIEVRIEKRVIVHILVAAGIMGVIVSLVKMIIHPAGIVPLLTSVVLGAVVYTVVTLKMNEGVARDIRQFFGQMVGRSDRE